MNPSCAQEDADSEVLASGECRNRMTEKSRWFSPYIEDSAAIIDMIPMAHAGAVIMRPTGIRTYTTE